MVKDIYSTCLQCSGPVLWKMPPMNRQCAWETNSQVPFKSTQQGFNTWATLLSHDALFPHTELERQEPIPVRKIKEVCFSTQIFVNYHTSVKSLLKQAFTATQLVRVFINFHTLYIGGSKYQSTYKVWSNSVHLFQIC